ncbi:hypothetical protein BpHYR1_004009 [Brachionus plicatilis]|uniref:Secreted protein n=1 Tax=Brachionus plicatilis TaxID=10195 RepID=A0A3M7T107_BRAPC|nr:hypothetical protein BpHYR1_004009 [Brachionus plicatilis]
MHYLIAHANSCLLVFLLIFERVCESELVSVCVCARALYITINGSDILALSLKWFLVGITQAIFVYPQMV